MTDFEILKKAWIQCWRTFNNTYYKGESMSGIYVKVETMTDNEVFEIIKDEFNKWFKSIQ